MGYKRSTSIVEHCVVVETNGTGRFMCETAKKAWDHLVEVYQGKGMYRFLSLMKRLTTTKLDEGKIGMKDYIRDVMETASEITATGNKLGDPVVIAFILNGLPESYRYLVVALESQIQTITYQDLSSRLMDEEKRQIVPMSLSRLSLGQQDNINANATRMNSIMCTICGKTGHSSKRCFNNPDAKRCEYCGHMGHEDSCHAKRFRQQKDKGMPAMPPAGSSSSLYQGARGN
jgi:gag-polypeptide of LTR copia-type